MGGGAGRATNNIAKELVRLGNDVDVLTSRLKGQKDREVHERMTIYRVPSWRKNIHECRMFGAFVYVFFAYFKLLRLVHKQNYDIIHYFFGLPTGLLSILPGKHQKIPYIVSLRGSDVPSYDLYNQRLEKVHHYLKPVTIKIWKGAKKVVALSDSLRMTALKTAPTQEIRVIRNGIDTEIFHPVETKENHKPLKLITVSRLLERKGVQYVLAAIAQLPKKDFSLTIVGLGNYETQLKKLCESYSLQSVVQFHGYCPNEMLPAMYQDSDVFLLTSLAESFGIVFLEAMACGLPVIAGRTGGIPAIISEENGILVEPKVIEEIKTAILTLRDKPEVRKQMGLINRRKVLKHYSWRRVAEMYQDVYQE